MVGLVGVPPGLGGGGDSPRRLLRGSETVPEFMQGWEGLVDVPFGLGEGLV